MDLKSCYLKTKGLKNDSDQIIKKSKSTHSLNSMIQMTSNQSSLTKSNQRRPYSTMDLITKRDILWDLKV